MLFSMNPKRKRKDLFDREEEMDKLRRSVQNYPITVVTGLRRVGKSSLLRVFLEENEGPDIFIDARKLYAKGGGKITIPSLVSSLEKEMANLSKKAKISELLKRIKGINLQGIGLEFESKKVSTVDVFEKLSEMAEKMGSSMIVCFDEAQYFRFYGSRGGRDFLAMLAYIHDELNSIRIILTGSEIGLLHDFLKTSDYESPLYGRGVNEIVVKPFSKDLAVEFLKKGFEESGVKPDFSFEDVVERIDGIPGYLVLFGMKYLETKDMERAVKAVYETMKSLVKKELKELEKRSKRYKKALKFISKGVDSWSDLKRSFHALGDNISDSRLYEILQNLMKMSFVEEVKGRYKIVDSVLKEVFKSV